MFHLIKRVFIVLLLTGSFWVGTVWADHGFLTEDLIRLHIVGSSDAYEDQQIKLKVRDAVISSLNREMKNLQDPQAAYQYIQDNIPKIQAIANDALAELGLDPDAVVTFCREQFDIRHYDTFSLPSGIYNCLRITLGEGQGKNWWCVVFPQICGTEQDFKEAAAEAGLTEVLAESLETEDGMQLRFYLLDLLGRFEKIVRQG